MWIGVAVVGLSWGLTGLPIGSFVPLVGLELALIGVSLAVLVWFELPQHILAWRRGAVGEEETARILATLPPTFVVLHDRRVPGSNANIDHIVIGPTGVFVVETKRYSGKLTVKGDEIFVAGRRRTAIVDQAKREATAVSQLLEAAGEAFEVTPLLCIHQAELPWRTTRVGGVAIIGDRELRGSVTRGEVRLSSDDVIRAATILTRALPSTAV